MFYVMQDSVIAIFRGPMKERIRRTLCGFAQIDVASFVCEDKCAYSMRDKVLSIRYWMLVQMSMVTSLNRSSALE